MEPWGDTAVGSTVRNGYSTMRRPRSNRRTACTQVSARLQRAWRSNKLEYRVSYRHASTMIWLSARPVGDMGVVDPGISERKDDD
jgi:hypothetical protein